MGAQFGHRSRYLFASFRHFAEIGRTPRAIRDEPFNSQAGVSEPTAVAVLIDHHIPDQCPQPTIKRPSTRVVLPEIGNDGVPDFLAHVLPIRVLRAMTAREPPDQGIAQ